MILGYVVAAKGAAQFFDNSPNNLPADQRMDEARELGLEDHWKALIGFTHVCQRWRNAAFSSSEFWTKLFITSPRAQRMLVDLHMANHMINLWTRNSGELPVTLYVDLRDVDWASVHSLVDAQSRHQAGDMAVLIEIGHRIRYIFHQLAVLNCTRFKQLGVAVEGRLVAEAAMTGLENGSAVLSGCKFPALEWLSFSISPDRDPNFALPQIPLDQIRWLRWGEPGSMPNLRALLCKNVFAPWIARSPTPKMPSELRTLVLDLSFFNIRFFTNNVMAGMLFALPHLEELTLRHHIVGTVDDHYTHPTVTDIPLPPPTNQQMEVMAPLRALRIERVEPLYLVQFWDYFRLDRLEELALDIWPGPADFVAPRALLNRIIRDPIHPWQNLNNLRRLYVPAFEVEFRCLSLSIFDGLFLQRGLTQITHLVVDHAVALVYCGIKMNNHSVLMLENLTHLHVLDADDFQFVTMGGVPWRSSERMSSPDIHLFFIEMLRVRTEMAQKPLEQLILPDWFALLLIEADFKKIGVTQEMAKTITLLPSKQQRVPEPVTSMRYLAHSEEYPDRPRHVYPCWAAEL